VTAPWATLLEAARHYPSPHNSQPIRVRVIDDSTAHVFYDLDRGLPAESFGIPFGHVCAGVFLESLAVVAADAGFEVREELALADMDFGAADRLHPIATVTLAPREPTEVDRGRRAAYDARRTNRRPYDSRVVPASALEPIREMAAAAGQTFADSTDPVVVADIIRVNQETLFDDLRNDAVHAEIMAWLRFSDEQARTSGDGLSADAMLMPGRLLRFAMGHRGIWEAPVIGSLIKSVYLRTMRGVAQVAWFEGPFAGPGDYLESGRLFMRAWLELTARGVALHPLGTVITNPRSHARFIEVAGIAEPPGRMAWMLVRLGYAKTPPVAYRRPVEEMLIP
jgi:hypothetical protein